MNNITPFEQAAVGNLYSVTIDGRSFTVLVKKKNTRFIHFSSVGMKAAGYNTQCFSKTDCSLHNLRELKV